MSGIEQWSQNVEVQANPGVRMLGYRHVTSSPQIPASVGREDFAIVPPDGWIGEMIAISIGWQSSAATTGSRRIDLLSTLSYGDGLTEPVERMIAQRATGSEFTYRAGVWVAGADVPITDFQRCVPANNTAQCADAYRGLYCDVNSPIIVRFYNLTEINDGTQRRVRATLLLRKVGR